MYTIDAIILKKEPSGEADCMITALTGRFVKIRLLAQGARKVEAKLKGHLEPISFSRLSFVVGRNGYRLVGAELLDFFQNIKNDPDRIRTAAEMVRLLDRALFEDTSGQNSGFFTLSRDAFLALNDPVQNKEECGRVFSLFKAGFLNEFGLLSPAFFEKDSSKSDKSTFLNVDKVP
ncbi:MAG: DNA repair protein RecO [Candidatus Sungbacteria bacterium]|nr:DNA repair protein RecO [Candidatus Sungbacteria bacterium]